MAETVEQRYSFSEYLAAEAESLVRHEFFWDNSQECSKSLSEMNKGFGFCLKQLQAKL
jgi:hypothetical protein